MECRINSELVGFDRPKQAFAAVISFKAISRCYKFYGHNVRRGRAEKFCGLMLVLRSDDGDNGDDRFSTLYQHCV